jgi:hypothetical protein
MKFITIETVRINLECVSYYEQIGSLVRFGCNDGKRDVECGTISNAKKTVEKLDSISHAEEIPSPEPEDYGDRMSSYRP